MEYKFLTHERFETIYDAFINSFSDYVVKMQPTKKQFKEMLTRRGVRLDISIGAYNDKQLIGFNLNGIGKFNNEITIYDCGTGIIPEFRGKGIVSLLFEHSLAKLKEAKASKYLLEVIENNVSALKAYKKMGFQINRYFQCFKANKVTDLFFKEATAKVNLTLENTVPWEILQTFWDYQPSWQNSIESIFRSNEDKIIVTANYDSQKIGYGIIYFDSGDIPQIAVAKEYRNKGIGTLLLSSLTHYSNSEIIKIINVDSNATNTISLVKNIGFKHFVNQYEMILDL